MTIYANLLKMGYTDEQIREAASTSTKTRSFTIAVSDTPDGYPLVGITYQCDYRAEEEWGIKELREALCGVDPWEPFINKGKGRYFTQFSDVPGSSLILSVEPIEQLPKWGEDILPDDASERAWKRRVASGEDYKDHWDGSGKYIREMGSARINARWNTLVELQEYARKIGVEKPARNKQAVVAQIDAADMPGEPNLWPGWFHNGKVLILRADNGIVADVLNLLHVAALERTLAFGSGGYGVFSSGIGLYDAADVGPKTHKEWSDTRKWNIKQMKKLKPVRQELERKGHAFYFLGNPTNGFKSKVNYSGDGHEETNPKDVYYWLNGASNWRDSNAPKYPQAYGWYTIEELKAEVFMYDAINKEAARKKREAEEKGQ